MRTISTVKRHSLPTLVTLILVALASVPATFAQSISNYSQDQIESDRAIVESTLQTVRSVVQETLGRVADQLGDAAGVLGLQSDDFGLYEGRETDLDDINEIISELRRHMRAMKREANVRDYTERIDRIERMERLLDDLSSEIRGLSREVAVYDDEYRSEPGYLSPGTYDRDGRRFRIHFDDDDDDYDDYDDHWRDRRDYRYDWWHSGHWSSWEGINVLGSSTLYPETLYRSMPATRYNRVEGFVLGAGIPPLHFYSWDRTRFYGQLGYAFALEDWRYQVGFETNVGGSRRNRNYLSLKLGAEYHHSTTTNDAWKVGTFSNSLAAFFAEEDYLDYYEIEGWSVYATKGVGTFGQVSVAYRQDDYFSLDKNTHWSLFDGPGFRENPLIDDGRMNSVVARLQTGYVRGFYSVPRGAALQAEAEFGEDFGGDFSFTRYEVDGRAYLPITYYGSLSLRSRVGYATGEVPFQKTFSLGGIGSVRAYPQNYFRGTQMFLGNAELAFDDVDILFGDLQPFGFVDLGWVGTSDNNFLAFDQDELFAAAGFGVGLDQRRLRIEVAWPIDDNGFDVEGPTVWFRLNPSF